MKVMITIVDTIVSSICGGGGGIFSMHLASSILPI